MIASATDRAHAACESGQQCGGLARPAQSLAYGPTKAALINLAEALFLDSAPQWARRECGEPWFRRYPADGQNDFTMPALDLAPKQRPQAMVRGWEDGEFEHALPATLHAAG